MELKKKRKILIIILSLLLSVGLILTAVFLSLHFVNKTPKTELDKRGLPVYKKPIKKTVDNADYYVSVNSGSDTNDGSKEKPFKTVNKVKDVIRELIKEKSNKVNKDIVVAIMGGEYYFKKGLSFNELDSLPNGHRITYTSYNKEEVVFSGGIKIKASDFKDLTSEDSLRLKEDARENVKVINLLEKGIDLETIGKLHSIGRYSQGKKYGEEAGTNVELFYDDQKMELSKYPNTGFSKIGQIIDYGEASENVPDIVDWDKTPSPRPPKFRVHEDMKERMKSWKKQTSGLNAIWTYGYFYWDWADVSSPVLDFDASLGELHLKYSSTYGIKEGGLYYVYNVFEELDSGGEYYIDRENGNLYVYFPKGYSKDSYITMSLLNENIISVNKTKNLTIDGLTLEYGKSGGIEVNSDNVVISNMLIRNISSDGIKVHGKDNLVIGNEVKNVGRNGIVVGNPLNYKEGNIDNDIRKDGLRIENNIVKNNYIHSYGENTKSGIAGISILGVGNKISHNEIFDAPFTGILYAGNEHIIEYNHIHHVVKMSSDAGAIYSGRNLSFFGNVIRYNVIADLGSGSFTPNGIYFDDCLAGQVAYGNLLVNIPGNGFLIGGGREHKIYDNVIINARDPIRYDSRAYDGLNGGWYKKNVITPDARHWKLLEDSKKLYTNWLNDSESVKVMKRSASDYSKIMKMLGFSQKEETDSALIPNGSVYNNIILSNGKHLGVVSEVVKKYAKVENNSIYDLKDSNITNSFLDFNSGNYSIKKGSIIAKENKNYKVVPYHLIGRIND